MQPGSVFGGEFIHDMQICPKLMACTPFYVKTANRRAGHAAPSIKEASCFRVILQSVCGILLYLILMFSPKLV